jgi:hypothetical protein
MLAASYRRLIMSERKFEKNPIVEELHMVGGNGNKPLPTIYSPYSNLAVALFGGVYGIAIFTALSLKRLGRYSAEGHTLMVMLCLWTGILFVSVYMSPGGPLSVLFGSSGGAAKFIHLLGRALALIYLGIFYIRHRIRYKTMKFMGEKPPDAWWPGVLSIIAGTIAGMIVAWVASVLRGTL